MDSPLEFIEQYRTTGQKKAEAPVIRLLLLGILAGFLIGMGGLSSTLASYAVDNPSLAKLISGLIFPFGLILVIFSGAELFTGNCLIFLPVLEGKVKWTGMLRNWVLVYLGNFLGSLFLSAAYVFCGTFSSGKDQLAVAMLKTAGTKVSLPFAQALVLGVLCNILVCLAVSSALRGHSAGSRAVGAYLPVAFFVMAGFEHSIANMYYISCGLFLKSLPQAGEWLLAAGIETGALSWSRFFLANLLPVTLGNIIGGCAFAGLLYATNRPSRAK